MQPSINFGNFVARHTLRTSNLDDLAAEDLEPNLLFEFDLFGSRFIEDGEIAFTYDKNLDILTMPSRKSAVNLMKEFRYSFVKTCRNPNGSLTDEFRNSVGAKIRIDYNYALFPLPEGFGYMVPIVQLNPRAKYRYGSFKSKIDLKRVLDAYPKNMINEVLVRLYTEIYNSAWQNYIG